MLFRSARIVTNYYQNHRRYVKSYESGQLNGDASSFSDIHNGNCKPVAAIDGKPIYPCGLIANSVFNGARSRARTSLGVC